MERNYRIYRYTNILNGMMYDGKTNKTKAKRAGKDGKNYIRDCPKFGEAIIQDGWENFKYEVLEDGLTKEEACERERYWIEKDNSIWPNGYNVSKGSGTLGLHNSFTGMYGKKHTEESKRKMSEVHKGLPIPLNGTSSKPVRQLTLDGQFIAEYPSCKEAERQTGISCSGIGKCCNGRQSTTKSDTGKCRWEFAD